MARFRPWYEDSGIASNACVTVIRQTAITRHERTQLGIGALLTAYPVVVDQPCGADAYICVPHCGGGLCTVVIVSFVTADLAVYRGETLNQQGQLSSSLTLRKAPLSASRDLRQLRDLTRRGSVRCRS